MPQGFYTWSQTAATNASADSSVNFAEGQAPSSLNDSSRAVMARLREWGNDIAGAIVTGGTSTAYTVTSNQVFDTLAHLNGQMIAFSPHTTNGATVTLNVDSLGAKPLRSSPNVELQSGVLVQGTPYVAVYNNSDGAFYLYGNFANPGIPLGMSGDYWGASAPTSAFALAYGQAISRTTYSALFSLFSTTYGTGDGSTTFNIPDLRGRVVAGKDDMGGSAASRLTSTYFGTSAASLGATGGSQNHTLTASELPTNIPYTDNGHTHSLADAEAQNSLSFNHSGSLGFGTGTHAAVGITDITAANNTIGITINPSGSNAHAIVQPTIIANKLIRII